MKKIILFALILIFLTGCNTHNKCESMYEKVYYENIFDDDYTSEYIEDITIDMVKEQFIDIKIHFYHKYPHYNEGSNDEKEKFTEEQNIKLANEFELEYTDLSKVEAMITISHKIITEDTIKQINSVICDDRVAGVFVFIQNQ